VVSRQPPELPGGTRWYESLEAIVGASDTDWRCCVGPNGLHAEQALICLQAGMHVAVEMPLTLDIPPRTSSRSTSTPTS
jgi:predicted dehydrogenase